MVSPTPSVGDDDSPGAGALANVSSYAENLHKTFVGLRAAPRDGQPIEGQVTVSTFGPGRIIVVEGMPHEIHRRVTPRDPTTGTFSLLINMEGSADIVHCLQKTSLGSNDVALVDGARSMDLSLQTAYRQVVVQFPRESVGRKHPSVFRSAGARLSAEEPGTKILVQMLSTLAATAASFGQEARCHSFDAAMALLGALPCAAPRGSSSQQRLARALADIEARLADPDLCPAEIAGLQGISRRRLDAIFAEQGLSVEQLLWERRLERAAAEIADPHRLSRRFLDVAISWGFNSEQHFSRRFRQRFGVPPGEYRRRARAARSG